MNNTKKRETSLDIVKGMATLFVVIEHFSWNKSQKACYLFPFWISMAVPIFMVVSGYLHSLSLSNKGITSLRDCYNPLLIFKRIVRYSIPFLFTFFIEITYLLFRHKIDFINILVGLLTGGIGPGSYYYPIMIQFVFIIPVIYYLIRKYDLKGFSICALFNVVFEIVFSVFNCSENVYRLLLFRYTTLIASGCYIAIGKKKVSNNLKIISIIIGLLYLYLINYYEYYIPLFNKAWSSTNMFSSLYIVPIISTIVNKTINKFKGIQFIGNISYYIFLVQMVYFAFAESHIESMVPNVFLCNIINIAICVVGGLLFRYILSKINIEDKLINCIK